MPDANPPLPLICASGVALWDARALFPDTAPRRRSRDAITGVAIHHDGTFLPPLETTNWHAELARLRAIYNHALAQGWLRFPYHAVGFQSGRAYLTLDILHSGSHVAGHNHHLAGIAAAGDYTQQQIPPSIYLALGTALAFLWGALERPLTDVRQHKVWDPAANTACPDSIAPGVVTAAADHLFPDTAPGPASPPAPARAGSQ
ncbi:MAG: hypothetical protein A2V63_13410 [Candidatus Eisenbacteria bacterium RBG_19FT_COMBO_70_11]|nr:MAG: hypothetical protein A2V63_13410 [Candidatus Eisenbacteria bacterium RBG_19FT_COMBO_70_11]